MFLVDFCVAKYMPEHKQNVNQSIFSMKFMTS